VASSKRILYHAVLRRTKHIYGQQLNGAAICFIITASGIQHRHHQEQRQSSIGISDKAPFYYYPLCFSCAFFRPLRSGGSLWGRGLGGGTTHIRIGKAKRRQFKRFLVSWKFICTTLRLKFITDFGSSFKNSTRIIF